jgi:hypothetical protein
LLENSDKLENSEKTAEITAAEQRDNNKRTAVRSGEQRPASVKFGIEIGANPVMRSIWEQSAGDQEQK